MSEGVRDSEWLTLYTPCTSQRASNATHMAFNTHTTSIGLSLEHIGVKDTMSLNNTDTCSNSLHVLSGVSPLRSWSAIGLGII